MHLRNPIVEKIYKKQKSRSGKTVINKRPVGILVAGLDFNNPKNIAIGYSLCHRKDKFDHVEVEGVVIHKPGFGKDLAANRAVDWSQATVHQLPPSIYKTFLKFTDRCRRYFKGATLPMWASIPEKKIVDGVREVSMPDEL